MKEKYNAVSFNLIPDNILGHDRRNSDDVLSDVVRGHDPLLGWEALGARSKTRSVDSGSPFVDSGTHFVDSETHFVDSGRQNGDCHSKKNRDQCDYISVRAGHLRTHLKTRTNAANATLPLFGLLL